MKTLHRILSSWQGLLAGIIALVIYLALPPILRAYDPTAAVFDAGYLQWVGLATVLFFSTIFFGWVGWQIAFASVDKKADTEIATWFEAFTPCQKWIITQGLFLAMLILFIVCLCIVPL
jgi:hypothetical protein